MSGLRDHGGGLDAAIADYGGARRDWIDLSTGINPNPYPVTDLDAGAWTALPDRGAMDRLCDAARRFWRVPDDAVILAAPGASALIARMPALWPAGRVRIDTPTYNEHRAAFEAQGWSVNASAPDIRVVVHPNNPTGTYWDGSEPAAITIVDESFCDIAPDRSHVSRTTETTIVLKSFGKFWGLAGLRLGFAIGPPDLMHRLGELLGPWAVAGPALEIGARALADQDWTESTRTRLEIDADRLDGLLTRAGASLVGGTPLFRLYEVDDARAWQDRLARAQLWSRVFPYSNTWLRLGLPPDHGWSRIRGAL